MLDGFQLLVAEGAKSRVRACPVGVSKEVGLTTSPKKNLSSGNFWLPRKAAFRQRVLYCLVHPGDKC
jgi:hypothetical protein